MSLPQRVSDSGEAVDVDLVPDNPYLLLTPGPLSTAKSVRAALLRDWCTWDEDYNALVQDLRRRLVRVATPSRGYTAVLMQGSGTFGVEAVIGSVLPSDGKLLVLANGAYGQRMAEISRRLRIPTVVHDSSELLPPDPAYLWQALAGDPAITHVAAVHCETTTGILNPVEAVGRIAKEFGKVFILDAMSSFGGIPMDVAALGADFLVTSANKCLQGVPGFSVIVARQAALLECRGWARSLSLDLLDQWHQMESAAGKWRFTSPTHAVHALAQALADLRGEGGVTARYLRYRQNQTVLVAGMRRLGFQCLLPEALQSPIITTFRTPPDPGYDFRRFYHALKARGFVIYPGKVTAADTFRIGTIGDVTPDDIHRLIGAVEASLFWR